MHSIRFISLELTLKLLNDQTITPAIMIMSNKTAKYKASMIMSNKATKYRVFAHNSFVYINLMPVVES